MVTVYLWLHRFPPPPPSCSNRESYCLLCDYYQRWSKQSRTLEGHSVLFVGAAEGNSMKSVLQTRLSGSEGKIKKLQVA